MNGVLLQFPAVKAPSYGGLTLTAGTWLYAQLPGSCSYDIVEVIRVESTGGPVAYSLGRGMTALPQSRITVRRDGGAGEVRDVLHEDDSTLRAFVRGNYRHHYAYLELVEPDADRRAEMVAYCRAEPARRTEEARAKQEESDRRNREDGYWFATLLHLCGAGDLRDVDYAKILRTACRELAGVKVTINVRRYSMASGLDFGAPDATQEQLATLAAVFPGLAYHKSNRWQYDDNGEREELPDAWACSDDAHPTKHEDRSDGMSDYYDPGGFRVGPAYSMAVATIIGEYVARKEGIAAK